MTSSPEMRRLLYLLRHVENVQRSCQVMALGIIGRGDFELGKDLLKNSMVHDQSKFDGIEFDTLNDNAWPRPDPDPDAAVFREALSQHVNGNLHHPEYWDSEPGAGDGIHRMKHVYIYEMVADWGSRSSEQGTNLRETIRARAMPRFGFRESDPVNAVIEDALGLLLEPQFA